MNKVKEEEISEELTKQLVRWYGCVVVVVGWGIECPGGAQAPCLLVTRGKNPGHVVDTTSETLC